MKYLILLLLVGSLHGAPSIIVSVAKVEQFNKQLLQLKETNKKLTERILLLSQEIRRLRKFNKKEPKWINITGS
jgi:cell division protein FtsB